MTILRTEFVPDDRQVLRPFTKRGYVIQLSENYSDSIRVLTIELADKWYGLILYNAFSHTYEELDFGVLRDYNYPYFCDHAPHPTAVREFARKNEYYLDSIGYEMIIGRWVMNVKSGHFGE